MWIFKIYSSGTRWASFGEVRVAELGGEEHPDRLTIFQSRPNLKKGSVSGCYCSFFTRLMIVALG
jgi:chitinase